MDFLLHKLFCLLLLIVPWLIWWKFCDRSRLFEVLTFGLLLSSIVVFIDTMGVYQGWWKYHEKLFNQVPHFVPMDYAALPVGYMITYQFVRTWKHYILAGVILSGTGAFIIEPIFIHIGLYEPLRWNHMNSFIIYFLIAVVLKLLFERLKRYVTDS
ncbi:CBO0543 family protein [Pseudalkalibacillus sp. A8]|uniref:CBO0543 family protein n=1 Tax=Pseudalkalibacillus sp. A8 TaxID=3382641 RepID=UPI0038B5FCD2